MPAQTLEELARSSGGKNDTTFSPTKMHLLALALGLR